jgi:transcriptional regulator with XRE-family HTH domain
MRTSQAFGPRLRALRHAAKRTQADVAFAANLDFTYLSKIEGGRNEAPSEDTIGRLLAAVDAPAAVYDEMYCLAGKVPSDVRAIILEHPEACGWVRERWGRGGADE